MIANYPKFRNIAQALGEDVHGETDRFAAMLAVGAVEDLKEDIGIPRSLADVSIPQTALESIVKDALTFRMLPNSPRKLGVDDLRIIVSKALEG